MPGRLLPWSTRMTSTMPSVLPLSSLCASLSPPSGLRLSKPCTSYPTNLRRKRPYGKCSSEAPSFCFPSIPATSPEPASSCANTPTVPWTSPTPRSSASRNERASAEYSLSTAAISPSTACTTAPAQSSSHNGSPTPAATSFPLVGDFDFVILRRVPRPCGFGFCKGGSLVFFFFYPLTSTGARRVPRVSPRGPYSLPTTHYPLSFHTFPHISTVSPIRLNPANSLKPLDFRQSYSNPRLPVRMTYSVNDKTIDNW